jgi:N-acetylglucosamine-6-phosphate deacetylase
MPDVLFAARVFTGSAMLENQLIYSDNGKITAIEPGLPYSGVKSVSNVAPGLIDTHINGGRQFHFTQHADLTTLEDIDLSARATGTAYTLPALITSSLDNILKGIDAVREYREKHPQTGVLGMHLEGPFLNPVKRGAHLLEYIKKPDDADLEKIIAHGRDVIRIMTIAPECFTPAQIQLLLDAGITLSAGHSNATYAEATAAFSQGIQLVTHLYNAMSAFGHRSPGLIGATFDHPQVYAPIIIDGVHCDFAAARIAYNIKRDKLFLISDALFISRGVQDFTWGSFNATLKNDQYVNTEGNLAGATISLGEAVYNAVNEIGIPLQEAIEMATIRPAKAIGLDHLVGRIEKGYPAVFTTFDDELKHFEVYSF